MAKVKKNVRKLLSIVKLCKRRMFAYMLTFPLMNLPVVERRRFNHHEASAPPVRIGGDSRLDAQLGIRHFGTLKEK